jgi:glycolate oxidase FAD binding subunit
VPGLGWRRDSIMSTALQPATTAELQELVLAAPRLSVRGGGSKPGLARPVANAVAVDLHGLSGILEYVPDEFVVTAQAGTPVSQIADELARHGQYLPFDPLLAGRGATLGGTVAANTCGSGSYRWGGVRDFLLGVRFVDGRGQLVRSGGKVIKSTAGFDLARFLVGSLGRYGILVELSFKVFPRPRSFLTLEFTYSSLAELQRALFRLAVEPWDIDALDIEPVGKTKFRLLVRLGGWEADLPDRAARLEEFLQAAGETLPQQTLLGDREASYWREVNQLAWVPPAATLLKVPLSGRSVPAFDARFPSAPRRYTAGGSVAWLAVEDLSAARAVLTELGLTGLQIWGVGGEPFVGPRRGLALAQRAKRALDPDGKFGEA